MSTISDVLNTVKTCYLKKHPGKTQAEFYSQLSERLRKLGKVIARENDILQEDITLLAPETELGRQSEKIFKSFLRWLDTQSKDKPSR